MASTTSQLVTRLQAMAGGPVTRRLAAWSLLLPRIAALEAEMRALADAELRKRCLSLRYRAKSREPLERLLPECYALVREAAQRTVGMRHFDVQILGGIALHHRSLAEMQTGEGKTLTATLPLVLNALSGKGAHLATANDYLARRDAELLRPLYQCLGLTVGLIQSDMPAELRRRAYACDITYGTAKEFGFDFLRDRLVLRELGQSSGGTLAGLFEPSAGRGQQTMQRGLHFALIDEADNVLIDEAGTPLVIGTPASDADPTDAACYSWAARMAPQFVEDQHFDVEHERRAVYLNAAGRQLVRQLPKPRELDRVGLVTLYEFVERAYKVQRFFARDRHYVIRDGAVLIVDEFTGRVAEGRRWRDGIHEAVEAKEGIEVRQSSGHAARITVQDFFLRYERLAGMSGTASTSARELRKIYHVRVVPIPTNRPCIRSQLSTKVLGTSEAKLAAIIDEVRQLHAAGRPVLIGTRSIDKSERLSRLLAEAGISHQVLNAHRLAEEAEIVAQAGQQAKVTVATNMAGRGTDICLGDGVASLGGLHVICTELHDAARVDRQLIGRCARQGDPGSFRQYLSLDDDILTEGLGPAPTRRWQALGRLRTASLERYERVFCRAQRNVERRNYRNRRVLLYHEQQRRKAHEQMGQDPYLDSPS